MTFSSNYRQLWSLFTEAACCAHRGWNPQSMSMRESQLNVLMRQSSPLRRNIIIHSVYIIMNGWLESFRYIAAAIVELVCILLVLPTYWGWWKLGRPVSFSPLELAKVCWSMCSRILAITNIFSRLSNHQSWPIAIPIPRVGTSPKQLATLIFNMEPPSL